MTEEMKEALDLAAGLLNRLSAADQERFRQEIKKVQDLNDRIRYES